MQPPLVRYAWYSCHRKWCGQAQQLIQDIATIPGRGPQLYRLVPVCPSCGQDLQMIGRAVQNPEDQ